MDKPTKTMAWNLDMPIGLDLIAQIKGTGEEKVRFRSRYLGMKPGEFLILQMPAVPSIRERLASRCSLVVRFMSSGTVFGFEAAVISHTMRPVPLFFLTFPETIESLNLRQAERVDTFIEAEGVMGEHVIKGAILDISAGGCRMTVDRSTGTHWPDVEPGDEVLLTFKLPSNGETLHLGAQIINAKKDVDTIDLGLKFAQDEYHKPVRDKISEYVEHVAAYLKGKTGAA